MAKGEGGKGECVTAVCRCSSSSWLLQWSFAVEHKLQKGFACPDFYWGSACFWTSLDIYFTTVSPHCCGIVLHRKTAVQHNRRWKAEDLFKLSTCLGWTVCWHSAFLQLVIGKFQLPKNIHFWFTVSSSVWSGKEWKFKKTNTIV